MDRHGKSLYLAAAAMMGGLGGMPITYNEPMYGPSRSSDVGPRKKFHLRDPGGPITDSTPLTKREKRRLKRQAQ